MKFTIPPSGRKTKMAQKKTIIPPAILCVLLLTGATSAAGFTHPGGLHSVSQIESTRALILAKEPLRRAAYAALLKQAGAALKRKPEAVADYNVPGYYKDAKGHSEAMGRLSQDAWAAYACAVVCQLAIEEDRLPYAGKAIEILDAWATTNRKTSNADGDLAMADAGAGLIFAAELMTGCDNWSMAQKELFKGWIRTVYLQSCQKITTRANNWGDWGILGCIASHHFLDDATALDKDIEHIRTRIDLEIEADGSMPHEIKRGKNGIWYTYFSLAPLTAACQIAWEARQVNLFHYKGRDGAGIEEALDYMLPYCHNPQSWPHYKEPDLSLPRPGNWPGNLYEAMAHIYGRQDYAVWMQSARPVMVYGHHYAWALPTLLQTNPVPK